MIARLPSRSYLQLVTRCVPSSLRRWLLIHNFRDRWLQDFYLVDKGSKKIPAEIKDRLFRKLQLIDDATCDLRPATCDLRPATWTCVHLRVTILKS